MSERKVVVDLQYGDEVRNPHELPDAARIQAWVEAAVDGSAAGAQLTVRIVGEGESRRLNETYRGRKGATNVLSFPFERPEWMDPPLLGDVVICAGRVEEEAREQGKRLESHWAHLVIHGVLHLQGYDHEAGEEAARMEARERELMAGLGFPDPYAGDITSRLPAQ